MNFKMNSCYAIQHNTLMQNNDVKMCTLYKINEIYCFGSKYKLKYANKSCEELDI